MFKITTLTKKHEMMPHWALLQQLNPAVTKEYLDSVLGDMIDHRYFMVAIWDGDRCIGLSGIWIATKIYSGKYLEMDNVVVDKEYRSKGVGNLMTEHIIELARNNGVRTLMLDAYLENEKAHAFYERFGFIKRGYHFLKFLD